MKIKFALFLVITIITLPCQAQNGETRVITPFISQLQGEVRNNLIRLSWKDSPDARGPVYLYRSQYPFEGAGPIRSANPVIIPYGIEYYVDEIDTGRITYYFAAASDISGKIYDTPIGSANNISIGGGASSPIYRPGITSLEAIVLGDRVEITFTESSAGSAAIYRSSRPITQTQDLLNAVIIQSKTSSPYTDYPVPGIPFYYAVISGDDLIRGTIEIIPGLNATRNPVEILSPSNGALSDRELRAMPLPQISVQTAVPGMNTYKETPYPAELEPEVVKALNSMPAPPTREAKKPRVFLRDLEASPSAVEEYTLGAIIKGPFSAKNWSAAASELVKFLALPRNPELRDRARFYLGQCYYFLEQPREGLFEFLAIRDRYPAEAMEWIQACLNYN